MGERDGRQAKDVQEALSDGGVRIGGNAYRRCIAVRVKPGGWTQARRQAFLDALAQTCNVTMATEAAGMRGKSAYDLRRADPAFADLWQEALALGYERLETALLRHALIGVNALEIGGEGAATPAGPADAVTEVSVAPAAPAAAVRRGHAVPGSGIASDSLTPMRVQVALAMLNRRDAAARRGGVPRGLRQVTLAEAEAALTRGLDAMARQLARAAPPPRPPRASGDGEPQ